MKIEHRIEIAAPVERVWELTLDVEAWPQLTPSITSVRRLDTGPMALGSQARIKQPAQSERTWTVTELQPLRRFAWATKVMGATMTGGHDLEAVPGGTRNTLSVRVEGALAPLLGLLIRRPIAKAIAMENEGFKRAAEGPASAPTGAHLVPAAR
ncbi:MAG: SRPBCC family protein [Dehalococcoidia bacterium]